jgi:predicted  nucleic acid-binding Zn-ribbon protein
VPVSIDRPPQENEIECARCGAYFHYELTRCPECGVNLYAPEEGIDDEYGQNIPGSPGPLDNILSFVRGIFSKITGRPYTAEEIFGESLDQAVLYNDLLDKVGGDHAVVDRLIEFERQRKPHSNRKIWLENAIERWERDN